MCRAAAARACGEYSAAAQLAADAVVLKQAADAAHAAAAIKIEVTNNMDRPDGLVSASVNWPAAITARLSMNWRPVSGGHHTD